VAKISFIVLKAACFLNHATMPFTANVSRSISEKETTLVQYARRVIRMISIERNLLNLALLMIRGIDLTEHWAEITSAIEDNPVPDEYKLWTVEVCGCLFVCFFFLLFFSFDFGFGFGFSICLGSVLFWFWISFWILHWFWIQFLFRFRFPFRFNYYYYLLLYIF
jgi:hypothetical protein